MESYDPEFMFTSCSTAWRIDDRIPGDIGCSWKLQQAAGAFIASGIATTRKEKAERSRLSLKIFRMSTADC